MPQTDYFKIKNEGVWFTTLPVISIKAKKSALDLNGNYEYSVPNPVGVALNLFEHFDNQELWFYDFNTSTMTRFMAGQVNKILTDKNNVLKIEGRGLSGLFTDKKINASWTEKRGDFILCDPTFGMIPDNYAGTLTTWNAFTDDYDKFDSWNTTRWGAQPAWVTVSGGELVATGNVGATRTVTDTTGYTYEVLEFRAKVDAASDAVYLGLKDVAGTSYVKFELAAAAVNCMTNNGGAGASTATTNPVTQTNYNYYRLEWDGTETRFFVNGVLEVTHSTFIPTTQLYPFFSLDTTAQILTLDYVKVITLTKKFDEYLSKQKLAADIVREICDFGNAMTTFTYYIDDDFDFHAFKKKSVSSGRVFGYRSTLYTDPYDQMKSLSLNEEAKDLYNSIRVEGGEKITTVVAPNWTDQTVGDGTTTAFTLGYKAMNPLTYVDVNAIQKIEDTDFTVTYGQDTTVVQFNTAPGNGQAIRFRYDYFLPIIATAKDPVSIVYYGVERKYVKSDRTIESEDRAQALARSLLLYFTDPRAVISAVVPLDPSLSVGETAMVDAPDRNINNAEYEVIECELTMASGAWDAKLTLSSNEINTSGEMMREILQQLKDLKQRGDTNEIITEEYFLDDGAGIAESLEYRTRAINDSWVWGITSIRGITRWGDRRSLPGAWNPV